MRTMLLKTNGKVEMVNAINLDDMCDAIGCCTIDIVRDRRFTHAPNLRVYDLIVDDDGLGDESLAVNALVMWHFGVVLVGNVLVAMHDGAGDRLAYEGPFLPDMRPESGFTFVALNDGPTPKAADADDGSCDN